MAQILVDTNVFLRFYDASHDMLGALDGLLKYSKNVTFSDQVISEFRRNRIEILLSMASALKKNDQEKIDLNVEKPVKQRIDMNSAFSKSLPDIAKMKKEIEDCNKKSRSIKSTQEKISSMLAKLAQDPNRDPVAKKVERLYKSDNVIKIPIEQGHFDKALRRKRLGNPPTSSKYSIGDEVIWEGILAKIKDDLILVTQDNSGFGSFRKILTDEFEEHSGGRKLEIVETCSKAIGIVGGNVPAAVSKAEEKEISDSKRLASLVSAATGSTQIMQGATAMTGVSGNYPFTASSWNTFSGNTNILTGVASLAGWASSSTCGSCGELLPSLANYCPRCGRSRH